MRRNKRKKSLLQDRLTWKRLLVTLVASVLLGMLYSLIFHFSAQDGGESGSLSGMISEKCVECADWLSGSGWNEAEKAEMTEELEYPLRKLAHFSEYACMGILVYMLLSQWVAQGRLLYLLTVLWVFLSASGDEFHQYFVPGRCASFTDVLIDTGGGIFGMLFCAAVCALYRKHRLKKTLPN